MYNDRRYSLARYSVNRGTKTVGIEESFSESMGAVAGAAVPVDLRCRCAEAMAGRARGTISVAAAISAANSLSASVRMSADVRIRLSAGEALRAGVYGQKNMPAALAAADDLTAAVLASKNIPASLELADSLTARTEGSKNIPAPFRASEILTAITEATSQITEQASFQLTIPPGGELRIDSGLFTVLLDGENALHTQSGDWINVSRELLRIIIESASGGQLQGQLIYTERYL